MITTGHLCSGYDGIGRGLTQAGIAHRALWHAEYDADASTTLAKHEPDVRNVGDLLAAPWHLAPQPDLITAGFPCQPVSGAGRQLADADPRWLWPGVINVIRTVRPGAVFLENVQNIVSIQGGAILRLILGDLREAGYAARWTVMGACAVGAPHHRHRWFLLAARHAGPGPTPEAVRIGTTALCGAPRSGGRFLLPTPMTTDGTSGPGRTPNREGSDDLRTVVSPLPTPDASEATRGGLLSPPVAARRVADPGRSSNLSEVVSSLLPTPTVRDATPRGEGSQEFWDVRSAKHAPPLGAVATLLPTPRASDGPNGGPNQRNGNGTYDALPGVVANLLPTPTASAYGSNQGGSAGRVGPVRYSLEQIAPDPERWGRYAEAVALWGNITGAPAPVPVEAGPKGGPRMSALLPEWMMGLPAGTLTGHLPRSAAIKQAGNGVVPQQAAAAWRILTGKPLPG